MSKISFIAPELRRVENVSASTLCLFIFQGMRPLLGITSLVDWRLHGHLSRLIIEGFLTAEPEQSLLMPLDSRLPQRHLLVIGLGDRAELTRDAFHSALEQMFNAVKGLGNRDIVLALPGRVEGLNESNKAMKWFLDCYDQNGDEQAITLIEPLKSQKAMLPEFEKWRLRKQVPAMENSQ